MREIKPKKMSNMSEVTMHEDRYPEFRINTDYLPEAKNWKVGSNYFVKLKLKQTGLHQGEGHYENLAEFDIIGIEVVGNKKKQAPRY